jgi:hypothetical protein
MERLEGAVAGLADALEDSIMLHGMGWTQWRATELQAKVAAAKALLGDSMITLPDLPAQVRSML